MSFPAVVVLLRSATGTDCILVSVIGPKGPCFCCQTATKQVILKRPKV